MPTTIDTSTSATATAYGNQRKIDRCQNGVLWAFFTPANGSALEGWRSADNGATWTFDKVAVTASNFSVFIDLDDYCHIAYRDASDGYVKHVRGTPNAGRTAYTWSAPTTVFATGGMDAVDCVAHREGSGWVAHVVISTQQFGPFFTVYQRLIITSGGSVSVGGYHELNSVAGSAHSSPSIDFNHTGDGKTVAGGTPHLYVAWSAGATGAGKGIRFKKATYSGGSWTWGTEREIDSTRYIASAYFNLNCLFDGTRVIIGGALYSGGADYLCLYERDAADTITTTRFNATSINPAGPYATSMTYDGNGNVYFVGVPAVATGQGIYRKWTRATTTLGSVTNIMGSNTGRTTVSAKRGYSSNRIEVVYTNGTSSPYNVVYDSILLNTAPNAPTITTLTGGEIVDRANTNRADWDFSDPDPGDSQSKYDLRYKLVGAGSWTDLTATTPNTFHDFAGGALAAGDYEWQVRTYDAAGVVGPYSASSFFTAADAPNPPTITNPLNGGTISAENELVEWSAPDQDSYQLRKVADAAGSPDTGTIYLDTGEVPTSGARSRSVAFPTNLRYEHVQMRIKDNGLWSSWASVRVHVSYDPPAEPTLTVSTLDQPGAIVVTPAHPAPTGDEPDVTSVDLYRRVVGDTGDGTRLAAGNAPTAPFADWAVAAGVAYEYRVQALGDNGTSTFSAWTA